MEFKILNQKFKRDAQCRHASLLSGRVLHLTMADLNEWVIAPMQKFVKDSVHLVRMCTKPDAKGAFLEGAARDLSTTIIVGRNPGLL